MSVLYSTEAFLTESNKRPDQFTKSFAEKVTTLEDGTLHFQGLEVQPFALATFGKKVTFDVTIDRVSPNVNRFPLPRCCEVFTKVHITGPYIIQNLDGSIKMHFDGMDDIHIPIGAIIHPSLFIVPEKEVEKINVTCECLCSEDRMAQSESQDNVIEDHRGVKFMVSSGMIL